MLVIGVATGLLLVAISGTGARAGELEMTSQKSPSSQGATGGVGDAGATPACDAIVRRAEVRHGIPRNLLRAMAIVESGRRIGDRRVAWAYTLNVDGTAFYLDTAKAAAALFRATAGDARSIDVGCMQINVTRWHPIAELDPAAENPAFSTVEEAIDPVVNVEYAAKFLRGLVVALGDWTNAVAVYHAGRAGSYERRRGYVCRVAVEHARLEGRDHAGLPLGCEPPIDQSVPPGPMARPGQFIPTEGLS